MAAIAVHVGDSPPSGDLAIVDVSGPNGARLLTFAWLSTHVQTLARALDRAAAAPLHCQPAALLHEGGWSAESVAAMLAIWKVGAVYCPIDAEWPATRLESTLADTLPQVLLCCGRALDHRVITVDAPVVSVEIAVPH